MAFKKTFVYAFLILAILNLTTGQSDSIATEAPTAPALPGLPPKPTLPIASALPTLPSLGRKRREATQDAVNQESA